MIIYKAKNNRNIIIIGLLLIVIVLGVFIYQMVQFNPKTTTQEDNSQQNEAYYKLQHDLGARRDKFGNYLMIETNTPSIIDGIITVGNLFYVEHNGVRKKLAGSVYNADISADGKKIVYLAYRGDCRYCIYLLDVEKNDHKLISENAAYPAISPDGSKVAYARRDDWEPGLGDYSPQSKDGLYVYNLEDKNTRQITIGPFDYSINWLDNEWFIFQSDRTESNTWIGSIGGSTIPLVHPIVPYIPRPNITRPMVENQFPSISKVSYKSGDYDVVLEIDLILRKLSKLKISPKGYYTDEGYFANY